MPPRHHIVSVPAAAAHTTSPVGVETRRTTRDHSTAVAAGQQLRAPTMPTHVHPGGWHAISLTVGALPLLKCENSGVGATDADVIRMLLTFRCRRYLIEL
jgi:hypothetical protein